MEPVKGGGLANLPEEARKVFDSINEGKGYSYASYAIRFAAGLDGVYKVLSGMSNFEQMEDNVSYMKEFAPVNEEELEAINKVRDILKNAGGIPCTACRYCVDGCPMKISIPDLFACYNNKKLYNDIMEFILEKMVKHLIVLNVVNVKEYVHSIYKLENYLKK